MDEKKKIAVLALLFVMLIAVGAFTMMPKEEPKPVAKSSDSKYGRAGAATEDEQNELKNPQVAFALPQRDPFQSALPPALDGQPFQARPQPQPQPIAASGMSGSFRPYSVGNLPTLPQAGDLQVQPVGQQTDDATTAPVPKPEPVFEYTVTGVVVGARPVVVFRDSQGNQRMVEAGKSLDGDTKVKAIGMNHVSIEFNGKTMRLPIGG